jgi:uncharacterized protein (DUF2252 family)
MPRVLQNGGEMPKDLPLIDPRRPAKARMEAGRALRERTPRAAHAEWVCPKDRPDPVAALREALRHDISHLLPIRYERMSVSPATFLRGAAMLMAADLARTPATGPWVQACGDCHLHNFGTFATPEGTPVFDINDFDETLPAPFEWDLKRLATSFVLEVQARHGRTSDGEAIARLAIKSYRAHMRDLVSLPPLDLWRERVNAMTLVAAIPDAKTRAREGRIVRDAAASAHAGYPHLIEKQDGRWRIIPNPPLIVPLTGQADDTFELLARSAFDTFRRSLPEERLMLLDRYELIDVAFKVVGVGSVGTFCAIGLFVSADGDPLLLQIKEARTSVLAAHTCPSRYQNNGERVVVGQRIMQTGGDVFLGWTAGGGDDQTCYVRRLKDPALARLADAVAARDLSHHARMCGRTLARAHARSADPALLAGYMGTSTTFDRAIARFATAYARQTREDWKQLRSALKSAPAGVPVP